MWYWIVMFILIAGSIVMLGVSFSSIKKNRAIADAQESGGRRRRRRNEDEDDEYDMPQRRRRRPEPEEEEPPSRRKKKRQWKIILEDIDSWDKYSFTFYDVVGIGRGKDGSMLKSIFRSWEMGEYLKCTVLSFLEVISST